MSLETILMSLDETDDRFSSHASAPEDKPKDHLPKTLPDPYAGMTRKEINRIPLDSEAKELVYEIQVCLQEAV